MQKILTYALVILTGMIMATFAAYYVLNQFVYPIKEKDVAEDVVREEVATATPEVIAEPAEEIVAEQVAETETFVGTLQAVNTGCFADGECFITVDGKHVTALMGWSQDTVGTIVGVDGFGNLEQYLGKQVEVSAMKVEEGKYTLYGNEAYYIKVLE